MTKEKKYLKVRNWDKWQSYRKDRGQPPWIKVHRALLRDPGWVALTDDQKGHLVSIWMLAADRGGEIPSSPTIIRKLCYLDTDPDLEVFVYHGFIDGDAKAATARSQPVNKVTAQRSSEEVRGEERRARAREDEIIPEGEPYETTNHLKDLILQNDHAARMPHSIEPWAIEIQRIHSVDGRGWDEIREVIKYSQASSFWKGIVANPMALRKHFPKIRAQAIRDKEEEAPKVVRAYEVAEDDDPDLTDDEYLMSREAYEAAVSGLLESPGMAYPKKGPASDTAQSGEAER